MKLWPVEWVFTPVVPSLPSGARVLDLTGMSDTALGSPDPSEWTIGRYDEVRNIYTTELFAGGRSLHVGVDIGGPVGTAVHAFADGMVFAVGYNPAAGDYGHVIVTEHTAPAGKIWALHGHLSAASSSRWSAGDRFKGGDLLGWFGAEDENGGWPPHVHFQLSVERPEGHDMPGAVHPVDRAEMLKRYPDPRLVLGPIY